MRYVLAFVLFVSGCAYETVEQPQQQNNDANPPIETGERYEESKPIIPDPPPCSTEVDTIVIVDGVQVHVKYVPPCNLGNIPVLSDPPEWWAKQKQN